MSYKEKEFYRTMISDVKDAYGFETREELEGYVKGFAGSRPYDIAFIQDKIATIYINGCAVGAVVKTRETELKGRNFFL